MKIENTAVPGASPTVAVTATLTVLGTPQDWVNTRAGT